MSGHPHPRFGHGRTQGELSIESAGKVLDFRFGLIIRYHASKRELESNAGVHVTDSDLFQGLF
jgi:hypothetical protein